MADDEDHNETTGRRGFLGGTLLGMAGGAMTGLAAHAQTGGGQGGSAGGPSRTGLSPTGAKASDAGYTSGILADGRRLVFVSGQGPNDLNADLETQCRQTLEHIGRVLSEADAGFEHVAILRSYFLDIANGLAAYRNVR